MASRVDFRRVGCLLKSLLRYEEFRSITGRLIPISYTIGSVETKNRLRFQHCVPDLRKLAKLRYYYAASLFKILGYTISRVGLVL